MVGTAAETGRIPFDEDSVYVRRFLAGDTSAFDTIYARYADKAFTVARGVLLDSDDAADAVQETFRLVFKGLSRFNQRSRLGTWIFRIAVNTSIQYGRRKKYKSRQVELDSISEMPMPVEAKPIEDPRVSAAMATLRPDDRAMLSLFYWEELSLNEIGDAMGCGANAAKTRLYRARERFRESYEAQENEE